MKGQNDARRIMQKIATVLAMAGGLLALTASVFLYCGYWHYYRYQEAIRNVRSLEREYPALEKRLRAVVNCYPLSVFYYELGRLHLRRAMAEVEFYQAQNSDIYLDKAREALLRAVEGNPLDHSFLWELSKVYFLYNYPIMTYAEKGRLICREALRRYPYNEFLFLNIALIFFEQWPLLEQSEKEWLAESLKRMIGADPRFIDRLRNRWRQSYRETRTLDARLAELKLSP
ncbi:MAG: hypothetical protein QME28_03650 [Candidatus Saccharicenans sp.]|nr:hypothetical protein [Candidatus Saccharicenans sp.]